MRFAGNIVGRRLRDVTLCHTHARSPVVRIRDNLSRHGNSVCHTQCSGKTRSNTDIYLIQITYL